MNFRIYEFRNLGWCAFIDRGDLRILSKLKQPVAQPPPAFKAKMINRKYNLRFVFNQIKVGKYRS